MNATKRKIKAAAALSILIVVGLVLTSWALILVSHNITGTVTINAKDGLVVYAFGTTTPVTDISFPAVDPGETVYSGYLTIKNLGNRPYSLTFIDDMPSSIGAISWWQDDADLGAIQILNNTITLQPGQEIGTDGTAPDTDQIRIMFVASPTALEGTYDSISITVNGEQV